MILFFGDSFTSGENNNYISYVNYLNLPNSINYGVSGTTLADYSLYPVGKTDLYSLLQEHKSELQKADSVFLEYGANDISSVVTGYTTIERVICSFIKCLDYIRQNSSAKIYFILISPNKKSIKLYGQNQINYLKKDYLKNTGIKVSTYKWIKYYNKLAKIVNSNTFKYNYNVCYMWKYVCHKYYIDKDNIHPTDVGYDLISENIREDI